MKRRWQSYTGQSWVSAQPTKLVVKKLELAEPLTNLDIPAGYGGLRLFVAWQGELLGYCTIWQSGPSVVERDRLLREALAGQEQKLIARLSNKIIPADRAADWLYTHFDELVAQSQ